MVGKQMPVSEPEATSILLVCVFAIPISLLGLVAFYRAWRARNES